MKLSVLFFWFSFNISFFHVFLCNDSQSSVRIRAPFQIKLSMKYTNNSCYKEYLSFNVDRKKLQNVVINESRNT